MGLEQYYDIVDHMLITLMAGDHGGFEANLVLLSLLMLEREYIDRLMLEKQKLVTVLTLAISEDVSRFAKMICYKSMVTLGSNDSEVQERLI